MIYAVITGLGRRGPWYHELLVPRIGDERWRNGHIEWKEMLTQAEPWDVEIETRRTVEVRLQAFVLGEILILDKPGGREVAGLTRKPSKWFIEYEEYESIDAAVCRAKQILENEEKQNAKR